jgi:hypothetical protein
MPNSTALQGESPGRTISFTSHLMSARLLGSPKRLVFWLLVLLNIVFPSLRFPSGWFFWAAIALPISMAAMLGIVRYIETSLERVRGFGLNLVQSVEDRERLESWWDNLDWRLQLMWSLLIAVSLAGFSLIFNANSHWTRYTDALGFLYQGFVAGEISYLLLLIPAWTFQLGQFPLRLNPVDPANTSNLRALAETAMTVAIVASLSLLAVTLFLRKWSAILFVSENRDGL